MPTGSQRDGFSSKLLWTIAGVFLGLVVAWFGLGDLRVDVPWSAPAPNGSASPNESAAPGPSSEVDAPSDPASSAAEPGVTEVNSTATPPGAPDATSEVAASADPEPASTPSLDTSPDSDTTALVVPLRMRADPETVTNQGERMTVSFWIEGARAKAGLDIEVAGLQRDQGGGCAKFSGQGCSLISEGYGEADRHGNAIVSVDVYPCAMLDYSSYDPATVQGTYRAWVRDRLSGKVRNATFSVTNATDLPPVESWQGGQCLA